MYFVRPESLTENSMILDVRSFDDYQKEKLCFPHIAIVAEDIDPDKFMKEYNPQGDKQVNILSSYGTVASDVAVRFERAGYPNVAVIIGGIIEAEYEGVPIVKN